MAFQTLLLFLISLLIGYVFVYCSIRFAARLNVGIDNPGDRKVHKRPTARIGGIGIFAGLLASLAMLAPDARTWSFLGGACIIMAVGLWDDFKGIGWKRKMLAVSAATSLSIFYGDVYVSTLGNLFSSGRMELGPFAVPFTYFCVIGVVSAINLIDGLNGLASGLSLIALLVLAYFSYLLGDWNVMFVCIALAGSTLAFLIFNFPKGRVFLGDAGSMLLGYSIAVISMSLFQRRGGYEPMIPVLVAAIPLYDAIRVMSMRMLRGRSPFAADMSHAHHILLRSGMGGNGIVVSFWCIAIFFSAAAVLMRELPGWIMLLFLANAYLILSIALMVFASSRRHIKDLEKGLPPEDIV